MRSLKLGVEPKIEGFSKIQGEPKSDRPTCPWRGGDQLPRRSHSRCHLPGPSTSAHVATFFPGQPVFGGDFPLFKPFDTPIYLVIPNLQAQSL